MKSTKLTPKVQLDQTLDICVDVSKSKLNVYFELGDQAFDDEWSNTIRQIEKKLCACRRLATEQGYEEGAVLFVGADRVFDQMVLALHNRTAADWEKWGVWLFGFFEAAGIAFLRARFHWFPLHPLGLAFQYSFGPWLYWFSLLLVWLVKGTLLHFGGVQAYLRGKPFFYGLAIGYVLGVVLSMWVDMIWFPVRGHGLHRW